MTLSIYFLTVTDDGNTNNYCGLENVAVVLGGQVSFSCYFGNYTPDWKFSSVGETTKIRIVLLDSYNISDKFQPYITENKDQNDISKLLINATQPDYAGSYECQPPPRFATNKPTIGKAQLIIIGEIFFFRPILSHVKKRN